MSQAQITNTEKQVISYSPRRLAKAFYCGKSASHDRYRPGTPTNAGIEFGLRKDKDISRFVSGERVDITPELEFFIMNTPQLTDDVKPSIDSKLLIDIEGTSYSIRLEGICDVLYPSRVVEVKTGKQKAWHEIQALSYAVTFERPCQIIYITRGYSIFVEPDKDKLISICKKAIGNEINKTTQRNDLCSECTLKQFCPEFQTNSTYIRSIAYLKEHINNKDLSFIII